MKNLTILILLLTCVLVNAQTTLIKADGYVDVRKGKLIKPANILIDGDQIKSINPSTLPDDTDIIDISRGGYFEISKEECFDLKLFDRRRTTNC